MIGRARSAALEPHHDMRLLEAPLNLDLAATISSLRFGGGRRLREASKARLNKIQNMIVFDRSGGCDDCSDDGSGYHSCSDGAIRYDHPGRVGQRTAEQPADVADGGSCVCV